MIIIYEYGFKFFIIKGFWTIVFIFIEVLGLINLMFFISPKNSLWIVQQDTQHNGYRRWLILRWQSSGGCRFNPDCRWVTIQEYPVLANRIRTGDPRGFNKGHSLKFREGSQDWQTPEEGRRTYRPKYCENNNNNKDEDNSPKTFNDKNH